MKCTGVPSDHVTANARQLAMSFSCSELNWSASGLRGRIFCSSQRHCATDASSSAVGVSALYSRSFGGPLPSYAKSNRPKSDSSFARHERATRSLPRLGDRERVEAVARDDVLGRVEAARVQFRGGRLQRVDLLRT